METMPQIITAVVSGANTLILGIVGLFLRQERRHRGQAPTMSQEERDLLVEIRTDVRAIKEDLVEERDRRHDLERRVNDHIATHR